MLTDKGAAELASHRTAPSRVAMDMYFEQLEAEGVSGGDRYLIDDGNLAVYTVLRDDSTFEIQVSIPGG
jgi:hypothetical protein